MPYFPLHLKQRYTREGCGTDAGLSRERATNALFWDLFSSSSCRIEVMLILVQSKKESPFTDNSRSALHIPYNPCGNVRHAVRAISLLHLSCRKVVCRSHGWSTRTC